MDAFVPLWPAVRFGLLLAGLLAPGAALLYALRLPRTLATCFAGSAFALYLTVLALQITGAGITPFTLSAGLVVVSLAAFAVGRLGVAPRVPTPLEDMPQRHEEPTHPNQQPGDRLLHLRDNGLQEPSTWLAPFTGMGPWTVLYALFWAAVIFRAWSEPLAGPDVEFRWGFLAEQMLRVGSLDFYPPRSATDFLSYFWAESIPPGASALHAWAYACAGGPIAPWTIPGVLLQLAALHELLWRTAHRIGGITAARYTCLAAAACPLLVWSVLIGQETGLTALALVGIVFSVGRWVDSRHAAWAALAALFAVIGASAREYGLVFAALGGLALIGVRANRRAWLAYLAVASVGLVWPLRVWVLTGNPVFSLAIGGLFPVNDQFLAWINHDADALGAMLTSTSGWLDIARYFLFFAPAASVGWTILAAAAGRRVPGARMASTAVIVVLVLWVVSVRYTNGGLFYSLRVASPALAVGTLAAGIGLAAFSRSSPHRMRFATIVTAAWVILLLPAVLALPQNPWREPWSGWPAFGRPTPPTTGGDDATVALVINSRRVSAPEPGRERGIVLADSPGFQRRFLPVGVHVVPPWSPQADWLFDLSLSPTEATRRWRASGIRHVVITKWQSHLDFFNQRSRWNRPPFQVQLIGETPSTAVFSIRAAD